MLTILFPLHKAMPWLDVISRNIELCPTNCSIVLSDRTLADCALEELCRRHSSDSRIRFLGEKGEPGWRTHVNWLLPLVRSELFSIMPQDDSITPGYYEKLSTALSERPDHVLSFGAIIAHNFEGHPNPVQFDGLPFATGNHEPWREALELEQRWNLGIAYRGVIRRRAARDIISTSGDHAADIIWVFGLALHGYVLEVPDAIYHKRYHPESAHVGWKTLEPAKRRWYLGRELVRQLYLHPWRLCRALVMLGLRPS